MNSDFDDFDVYRDLCNSPTLYVSPRELFEVMLPNDGTVCFIGMVDRVDGKINVKTRNGEVERCRVVLTNNIDWKVQITIWGGKINRVLHHFQTTFVIHISGAFSQPRHSSSLGNVKMDLTIKDYTIVNVIGKIQNSEEIKSYVPIDMSNIMNSTLKYVTLEGFLKYEFTEDTYESVCISSLGSGKFRFEIRCKDRNVLNKFKIKTKLQISGILKTDKMPNFLFVENISDIKIIPGTISDEDFYKSTFLPKKRKAEEDLEP